MKLLFDLFPVVVFFICFKLFGIYTATAFAMGASLLQVIIYRIKHQRFETMHIVGLAMILILGGATLYLHNPEFIKWKPTGIYWISALVFLASMFIGPKTLIQKMIGDNIDLPNRIWSRLNLAWVMFFILMGGLNLYVAYQFDNDTWVNFKLFGCSGSTLLFVFIQALYISRHIIDTEKGSPLKSNR